MLFFGQKIILKKKDNRMDTTSYEQAEKDHPLGLPGYE